MYAKRFVACLIFVLSPVCAFAVDDALGIDPRILSDCDRAMRGDPTTDAAFWCRQLAAQLTSYNHETSERALSTNRAAAYESAGKLAIIFDLDPGKAVPRQGGTGLSWYEKLKWMLSWYGAMAFFISACVSFVLFVSARVFNATRAAVLFGMLVPTCLVAGILNFLVMIYGNFGWTGVLTALFAFVVVAWGLLAKGSTFSADGTSGEWSAIGEARAAARAGRDYLGNRLPWLRR